MEFNAAFATDIGRKRQQNQDNGASRPDLGLFLVADGMGGHAGGETASALAAERIPQVVGEARSKEGFSPRESIAEAIRAANASIQERGNSEPTLQGMGTTATALLFHDDKLTIGHVGDSRCYYLRPGAWWQLTRDHSLVEEKLRAGLITREQMKTDRMRNVITRSVGFEAEVNVDVYEKMVQPGDLYLVCSDGLSGLVDEAQILNVVETEIFEKGDADAAVNKLVEMANENGGDDNITVAIVQVTEG